MKIGLFGIYGVYNFGCEAIIRGACDFLRKKYPNCEIFYFSFSFEYDSQILKDLHINIVEVKRTTSLFKRIANRVVEIVNPNHRLLMFNYREIIRNVDVICSIGGDIYTIPKFLREQKKYPFYNTLVNFCDKAVAEGKEVVVYGASVGPFGSYQKAVDYYLGHLKKYKKIYCREEESISYLKSLGMTNVEFSPDPAFRVRLPNTDGEKRYFGFNFSPLSFKEVNGRVDGEVIVKIAELMDSVCEKYGKKILFIPHVISKDNLDDDYTFLSEVRMKMKHSNSVDIADHAGGYLGIKLQLRECELVVSARMHCAINAIVEGVPTVFLAYSQKSVGMCRYVYGNDDLVIGVNDIFTGLIEKIDFLRRNNARIRIEIEQRLKEIGLE